MHRKKELPLAKTGLLLLMLMVWSLPSIAQSFFGGITGAVVDSTDAVVPGAVVTATNLGTSESKRVKSSASGEYRFADLVPAEYKVTVEATGFKRFEVQPVVVHVDDTVRVDAKMQLGAVTETVEITSVAPLLQTESGTVGTEIDQKVVEQMPLNGRNPMNLLSLAPGVVANSGASGSASFNLGNRTQNGSWGSYQIGGAFNNENAEYIDGAPVNVLGGSTVALVPTQDDVQEFRVQTSVPSAEFGRFGGGVIEMTTKSGTNGFHGSLYEYFRNTVLNANTFTADNEHLPKTPFHQNQYGVAIGGPIKRDKAFFFFNWENFSLREGSPINTNVPTANQRNGIFAKPIEDPSGKCAVLANTPAPGQYEIPKSCIDATSAVMLDYFPLPNSTANPNFNYVSAPTIGDDTTQYNGRVDYAISGKQRLFGKYTQWVVNDIGQDAFNNANGFPTTYGSTHNKTYTAVVGDTYTFSPSTLGDLRVSYLRELFNNPGPGLDNVDMGQFGPAYAALAPHLTYTALPGLTFSGPDSIYNLNPISEVQFFTYQNYAINGSVTKILGTHALKFGGEGVLRQNTGTGTFHNPAGFSTFLPSTTAVPGVTGSGDEVASFLLGEFSNDNIETVLPTTTYNFSYGFYGTDAWKAARNLTVNFGLRWELPGGLQEKKDRATVLLPSTLDAVTGSAPTVALVNSSQYSSRSMEPYHYMLLSPRVSFAQSFGTQVVVRGGYGLTYLPPDLPPGVMAYTSPINAAVTTSTNGAVPTYFQANPFPNGILEPSGRSNPNFAKSLLGQVVDEPVPTSLYPYMQQYDLAVAKQWSGDWLTEIDYVGTKGTHLLVNVPLGLDQVTDSQAAALQAAENAFGNAPTASQVNSILAIGKAERPYGNLYTNLQNAASYTASSNYNAMYLILQKRFKSSGFLNANYTWSKFLTDTDIPNNFSNAYTGSGAAPQDFYKPSNDYSIAGFDLPNRLVVNYSLDLPFGKGQRYAHFTGVPGVLVSGWGFSGISTFQSGLPLIFTTNGNYLSQNLGAGTIRPNYVPGCNRKTSGSAFEKFQQNNWFNASCFTKPGDFSFGDESRVDPVLRGQNTANFDFSVFKATQIRESVNLQFRAEAFNLFNRVQFNLPGQTLGGVGAYGPYNTSTGATNNRVIQLSLRLNY